MGNKEQKEHPSKLTMHIPNLAPMPEYIKKTKTAPERRHYVDKNESERESKLLKEDLSSGYKEKSTYAGEFGMEYNLDKSFQEPRFVRPKLDANANLEKVNTLMTTIRKPLTSTNNRQVTQKLQLKQK
ncbi:UNVERIFIED_CONTAM: hypothetical protein HDU68_009834 [Siphonaria sp. JEL0065]|nr:hypothetical protein HDU68_009834 [Siphonaria sp. JEL0065]